jgi:hypothetical protein
MNHVDIQNHFIRKFIYVTTWARFLLHNLLITQMVKIPIFYGIRSFIAVFKTSATNICSGPLNLSPHINPISFRLISYGKIEWCPPRIQFDVGLDLFRTPFRV